MQKTSGDKEKQGELLSVLAALDANALQGVLLERAKQAALAMAVELLEQDAEALCGPRYSRKTDPQCHRGGSERSAVVLEGARYGIRRPRVRTAHREVALPTLAKLQAQDLLDEQMYHRLVLGVSTRNYEPVINGYTQKLGVSRSSVSRAFVRASQKDLDSLNEGPLGEYSFGGFRGRCGFRGLSIQQPRAPASTLPLLLAPCSLIHRFRPAASPLGSHPHAALELA